MADVITRFKLETTQYDSKLRDASKGLAEYTRQATQAGNEFGKFTQANVEAARALGTITPSANNAKDKVKELVTAFNDAAKAYNALTKEQQQSDFGKAMAESLGQLSQQLKEAKKELYDMGDAVKNAGSGGLFSGLGDKMSGALQVFAGNMLTKAAGAVAGLGTEMVDMVQQGVALAQQGEGIRIAFERLGRGDILQGLREATHGTVTDLELMKAAVKFNDFKLPLDELGVLLQFAQQKAKDTGQSVDYMVDSIVTGLGRKSLMILDNLGLSANEVKEKMKETGDMTKAVGEIIREQMSKAGDYVETAADRAAQAHVSLQNKMEELGRKFSPLQEASNNFWTSMKIGILDVVGGPLTNLLNKLTEAGRLMNAYGQIGGNQKVGRMTQNLSNAREGNRQSIYQQQQQQFWRYINPREQQIKDIRAWQRGERGEALQGRINAITEKYGSLDVTKIQAEVDAAKKMLADYQSAAKQILQPIKQEITPTITTSGGAKGGTNRTGTKVTPKEILPEGSVAALTKQMQELQKEQQLVTSYDGWQEYQQKIEAVSDRISLLKGELPKDKEAVFTVTAETSEALDKLRSIEGVKIDPNGVTVTADTSEALRSVHDLIGNLEGTTVQLKVKADPQDMAIGTSIQNDAGMSAYIASIKQQLETADYGTSLYNGLSAQLADMTTLQNLVGESLKAGLGTAMFDAADATGKDLWTRAMEGGVEDTDWQTIIDKINEKLKEMKLEPISIEFKTGEIAKDGKIIKSSYKDAASAVNSLGSALAGLDDPAAKIAGVIAQSIANVALAFSSAQLKDAETGNVWYWIAAVASGAAAMVSTIATIHSATGYARGGVIKAANGAAIPGIFTVPGTTYSNDQIPAMLNAGETVLTRAQAGNIASQLQGAGGSINLNGVLTGENIFLSADRYARRSGRGELVTFHR